MTKSKIVHFNLYCTLTTRIVHSNLYCKFIKKWRPFWKQNFNLGSYISNLGSYIFLIFRYVIRGSYIFFGMYDPDSKMYDPEYPKFMHFQFFKALPNHTFSSRSGLKGFMALSNQILDQFGYLTDGFGENARIVPGSYARLCQPNLT